MIDELLNIIDNTVKSGYDVSDRTTIARWFDHNDQDLTATINKAIKQGLITKSGNIYNLTYQGEKRVNR